MVTVDTDGGFKTFLCNVDTALLDYRKHIVFSFRISTSS